MTAVDLMTLAIDCGGLSIKASVLDGKGTLHANPIATPTPYPLSPAKLIATFQELADKLPPFDRVTIGMPGMIRHGVVVHTPHYINTKGPLTRVDPGLLTLWRGFDMQSSVSNHFGLPALVMNDAEVHAAGLITGSGLEVVVTLGTGLGLSLIHI